MRILKANITQQVIEYLKHNIENGTWTVGGKIPSENDLTQVLGVSRASVRVAIQQFIALDVLESLHGKGTFVRTNDIAGIRSNIHVIDDANYDDIHQVLEFRRIVETEAVYLATQKTTEEMTSKLEIYLKNMKLSVGHSEEFVKQDMLFHEEICHATGNRLLENSLKQVFRQSAKNHQQINEAFGYNDGVYYHTLLLKAIQDKDARKAKKLMREHLQQAIDRLMIEQ